jgi:hypothetical protein
MNSNQVTTKSRRAIFPVFLAGIPSKTKGVLISLRGQQIALGPQTNNKLKSPTELRWSCVLVVAEISRKTKGVFQIVSSLPGQPLPVINQYSTC